MSNMRPDIPTLATHVHYFTACRAALARAVQEIERGELTKWDAVIRLRGEYKRAWRNRRAGA